MRETKETKNGGITLIALVITIIVLLILAGISIATLTGNNGILTQAKLAKENTAQAKEEEERKLEKNNEYINEKIQNVVPGKVVTKTSKDNYIDSNGDKATIPEGFIVDETEKTISKGLVVHGPDKANGDNGSEFVWVPVPDINNMAQCSKTGDSECNLKLDGEVLKCTTHNNNEEIIGKLYRRDYEDNYKITTDTFSYEADDGVREPAILSSGDNDTKYNNNFFTLESLKADYKNMATSAAKYGGFYVGRYETSLSNATATSPGDGDAQSKAGVIPTSVKNSATYTWYGLYNKQNKTYTGTNNSVESSMIWGSQFDRILNWAKDGEDKEKLLMKSLGNNSSEGVTTTGNDAYSNDSINNIRDLCGNLYTYSLVAYASDTRAVYGGYWSSNTNVYHWLSYDNVFSTWNAYGSRMTLYIK